MRCFVALAGLLLLQVFTAEGVANIGANCADPKDCPANADCVTAGSTPCTCNTGYMAKPDNTACLPNIGTNCGDPKDCPANADCTTAGSTPCTCNTGYSPTTDKTGCDKDADSGAGVTALSIVLLLASFVTSRFL